QVSDHDLGASGPQRRRPVVLAADHGANRKPAIEEQAGHGSPDCPDFAGCPGYEDWFVIRRIHSRFYLGLICRDARQDRRWSTIQRCCLGVSQLSKAVAKFFRKKLRLFPGGKVSTFVELV